MALPRYDTPDWNHAHWFYRGLYRTIRRPLKWLFRVNARGAERFPETGGVIVAMNHDSVIDPIVVADVAPRPIFFLAKESLFAGPVRRRFFEGIGQIEVDRRAGGNDPAVQKARELVERGDMVGVYPEGTRSSYPNFLRPKRGMARLALATGAPVVPVALLTHHVWPKPKLLPRLGRPIYVNVGTPMRFAGKGDRVDDEGFTQEVADVIFDRVRALCHEAEAAYQAREAWAW